MLRGLTENQRGWMSAVASATGGATLALGGLECVHQPQPHGDLMLPFPEREGALAEVIAWAREQRVRAIGWWDYEDPERPELLRHGFSSGWQPHWMALSELDPSFSDPRVEEAHDVPEYDAYGQALLALTRRRPRHSHLFVARVDGAFAGHAWLHVEGGVGGLFDLFVVPELRRRGLGRALTLTACARAAELGLPAVTLNAEGEGEPLYDALGFRSLGYGRTWWLHAP